MADRSNDWRWWLVYLWIAVSTLSIRSKILHMTCLACIFYFPSMIIDEFGKYDAIADFSIMYYLFFKFLNVILIIELFIIFNSKTKANEV